MDAMTYVHWTRSTTSAIDYYIYLRKQGYKHRTAYLSVLMRFCPSGEDLQVRLNRRYSSPAWNY